MISGFDDVILGISPMFDGILYDNHYGQIILFRR